MKIRLVILNLLLISLLSSCSDGTPDVDAGSGYKFTFNNRGGRTCLVDGSNVVVISEHIVDNEFNNKFIVVEQKPMDIFLKCINSNHSYDTCKIEFEKSVFRQYWIVDKQKKIIYGPFKKMDYLKKAKMLGVPTGLNINPI
jgi:hypothetical protein